jgi:hypothetical protein
MAQVDTVNVAKSDLVAAWTVLENLAVSLDQIGSVFSGQKSTADGAASQRGFQKALAAYLTPELVKAINDARVRLGQYIPDVEAEALSERIAYWNYTAAPKGSSETA